MVKDKKQVRINESRVCSTRKIKSDHMKFVKLLTLFLYVQATRRRERVMHRPKKVDTKETIEIIDITLGDSETRKRLRLKIICLGIQNGHVLELKVGSHIFTFELVVDVKELLCLMFIINGK